MSTVLITGGTGLVGKALTRALLDRGHEVIILTRDKDRKPEGRLTYVFWDPASGALDEQAFARADAIVHLAGAGVADKRWTARRKREILDSRVKSGQLLVDAMGRIPNRVRTVIGASAIGWYGADTVIPNPRPFGETDPPAKDFLGETCRLWEESLSPLRNNETRLVQFRIGIVLSKEGGALKEFMKPLRFGVAAILGSGKQVVSWIHIDDLVNLFIASLENEGFKGVYNAVAPAPVSNRELTTCLARSLRTRFIPLHVPALFLKVLLGEMSIEVLKSATVSARKVLATGFAFKFPSIEKALEPSPRA